MWNDGMPDASQNMATPDADPAAMPACGQCGRTNDSLMRCSLCLEVFYCNRECQVVAWKQGHKKACRRAAPASSPSGTMKPSRTGAAFDGIEYTHPFVRDSTRFYEQITATHCADLMDQGFTIIDNFLGNEWSHALLTELQFLVKKELLEPNKTQFPSTTTPGAVAQYAKPHIFEADLHNAAVRTQVPELNALFHQDDLLLALAQHTNLPLQPGTQGKTLKVQFNEGHGGCFPCHYDNPGRPNKRRLTCLLYLNPSWTNGDGGEIQFYPFLTTPVVVAPRMDRLVVFSSDRVLHRVLPARAPRYCLTVWIDGHDVNTDEHAALNVTASDLEHWDGFVAKLAASPVQRLLSRGVYAEEYLESLTQCMADDAPDGFRDMLHSHNAHLARVKANAPLQSLVDKLRDHKFANASSTATIVL
ncbi:hypothetical protein H310_13301 [Aphanomyces invadans]|uniref:MYND-type domain-containing protein n=1 Tax=Aphanomyces invadans TaxID=157072 RepID=A0A024TEK5_9STRA|nr:hypothetical protein H310_13301 [Aphanomyces invadans]ETV92419.1 hypothetical protein H310_13301 [Aphanomyces invadans]|eukprot:XP_008878970.1 hypothetical protein H310_13301 [Aphanomyces invadans]